MRTFSQTFLYAPQQLIPFRDVLTQIIVFLCYLLINFLLMIVFAATSSALISLMSGVAILFMLDDGKNMANHTRIE